MKTPYLDEQSTGIPSLVVIPFINSVVSSRNSSVYLQFFDDNGALEYSLYGDLLFNISRSINNIIILYINGLLIKSGYYRV